MIKKADKEILEMALIGYDQLIAEMTKLREAVSRRLKGYHRQNSPVLAEIDTAIRRQHLSTGARRRIAAAQRKRWKEYRAKKAGKKAAK